MFEDPSLPKDGPGHQVSNGNFLLTELIVTVIPAPPAASPVPALGVPAIAALLLAFFTIGRRTARGA